MAITKYFYLDTATDVFLLDGDAIPRGRYDLIFDLNDTVVTLVASSTGRCILEAIEITNLLKENDDPYIDKADLLAGIADLFSNEDRNPGTPIPFDGIITNLYAEHALSPLTIPTPPTNAEGGVTHPDVIDFNLINGGTWNGYRYWMGFTPLPTLNPDANENPCIVASNDKLTWVIPDGGSNPITPAPPISYNSDITLWFDNHTLYVYYRTWTFAPNKFWVAYKTSIDGITWSAEQHAYEIVIVDEAIGEITSPSIIKNNSTYYMYAINANSATIYDRPLYRYASNSCNNFTDNRELCTIDVTNTILAETTSDKYYPWHFNMRYINGHYLGIIYYRANNLGADFTNEQLFLATSSDGVNFTLSKYPLFTSYVKNAGKWDVGFYRCAIVPKIVGSDVWFDLWYPGWANDHEVYPTLIGYTEIKKITSGIDHIYGGNTINALRDAEVTDAVALDGYVFGDDCNRADSNLGASACGINYTITTGTPLIRSNYITAGAGVAAAFTLTTPVNFELSFDAINGNGATTTDSGFLIDTKSKATAKFFRIYDGIENTKVIKRVSTTTLELERRHKAFLKTDINNFKIIWNGANVKYLVNDCLYWDRTLTVADFVDQADMDDMLGQTTMRMYWVANCGARVKNITIKAI